MIDRVCFTPLASLSFVRLAIRYSKYLLACVHDLSLPFFS